MSYQPNKRTAHIVERATEILQSLEYKPSLRYIFYRLFQEGFYSGKGAYSNWGALASRLRKERYSIWRPDSLVDETRTSYREWHGYETTAEWLNGIKAECKLDPWYQRSTYVEAWFEARAMIQQFARYTDRMTLRPMAGQPSISFKAEIASSLEDIREKYGKPINVLYFGDYDLGGIRIFRSVVEDVRDWCRIPFEVYRVGINLEQVKNYGVPENPDKPGQFQWEALEDWQAREIIEGALGDYAGVSTSLETTYTAAFRPYLRKAVESFREDYE